MKILVSIILCLWLTINVGIGQSFPNIDLKQVPNSCLFNTNSMKLNQFADQAGDNCPTAPWFVSHGTPDISGSQFSPDRFVFIGSAKNGNNSGDKRSEGVSYRQTFFKNKWYKLNISYIGNVDKFNIILGNNVPIGSVHSDLNPRSAAVPDVTDKQIVFDGSGNVSPFITKDFIFIPKKDFECLWFYSEDSHGAPAAGELNELTFKINSLMCDPDPIKLITTTNSTFDYGARGNGLPMHISLPPTLSASERINIIPRQTVEVYQNTQIHWPVFTKDPKINLTARKSILIKPDNNQTKSFFVAHYGSIFSAKISTDIGCEDACEGYLPWESSYCSYVAPTFINKCDVQPAFTEFRLVSNHPQSYNAYRAEIVVHKSGADFKYPVFTKVWEDPLKRALPEGCVVWKPGPLDYGNYNVYIKLTNCNGDYDVRNTDAHRIDEHRTRFDVTVLCWSPFPDERKLLINNSLEQSKFINDNIVNPNADSSKLSNYSMKYNAKAGVSIKVFPNPTSNVIRMVSNSNIGKAVIKITNIFGTNEQSFTNDNILENSPVEYDMSHLPTGVYIVSIISNNKIISRTKITKL